ncbi:MAG: class I SAM-dependent methyltransferase [Bacteroidetes bacterium]|nr:class I SAM-dependent methyltransferase [Bacteroidota bacterium]MBX7044467.1 class I SAM-dependent methyltransferase [Ignavibacteria bacterium]
MPTNKIVPDLSGTAFVVNVSRSEKVMLSKDIYAKLWTTEEAIFLYHELQKQVYQYDDLFISLRHRFFYEKQKEFIKTHKNPVIINIGSGFTNYPYLLEGDFEYVEIDLENIVYYKKEAIEKFQKNALLPYRDVYYYPIDLNNIIDREYLRSKLNGAIATSSRSMIIMEGLTFFLDKTILDWLFKLLGSIQKKGSEIVFDFWKPDAPEYPVLRKLKTFLEGHFGYEQKEYFLFDRDYIESKKDYVISELKTIQDIEKLYAGTNFFDNKDNVIPANLCTLVKL